METLTTELIKAKILTDQKWLERGILAIYEKQTRQEQQAQHTIEHNGVGFNGPDGNFLSYTARWLGSGKHLSGNFLPKARKRMQKYCSQLLTIAEEKSNDR